MHSFGACRRFCLALGWDAVDVTLNPMKAQQLQSAKGQQSAIPQPSSCVYRIAFAVQYAPVALGWGVESKELCDRHAIDTEQTEGPSMPVLCVD